MADRVAAASPPGSIGALREEIARLLAAAGVPLPRDEARDAIAALLDVPRFWSVTHAREAAEPALREAALRAVRRRAAGAPFAYAVGRSAFRHLTLDVDERVLVPRQETELLPELVLARVRAPGGVAVDVGTGSGAIALALASEGSFERVVATDVSLDALAVARRNAELVAPALREVVRAHLGRAVAGAHLRAPLARPRRFLLRDAEVEEARPQHLHRLQLVLQLRLLVLLAHHQAGRQVRDAHRGVGGVDALAAGARGAEDVDAQVLVLDLHVHLLRLGQHGHGRGGGVDAALALRRRHALHAVHAALPAEGAVGVTVHLEDRLAHAAERAFGQREQLPAPAATLDVARVHAVEVRGEERGLVAAGARAELDDRRAVVERIARTEERLEGLLQPRHVGLQAHDLALRLVGELGVVNGNEPADIRELVLGPFELPGERDDLLESPVFPAQLGEAGRVSRRRRVGEQVLDLGGALERLGQSVAETQAFVPYFWRKRSTRPAVSMSFCLPVKNGWHAEQMSVWISACVDRVSNVLPHAHLTVAVAYTGWMSVFTECLVVKLSSYRI